MSLPEVLLTLGRDRRRQVHRLLEETIATASAFAGGQPLKDFTTELMASINPRTEPAEHPDAIAQSLGIPTAS